MALVGLGFRRISMQPSRFGAVKAMVRSLDAEALSRYMETLLDRPDHSVRQKLTAYARDHGVEIGDL